MPKSVRRRCRQEGRAMVEFARQPSGGSRADAAFSAHQCHPRRPCCLGSPAAAQTAGSYTAAQAEAGRAVFDRSCATCHMRDLSGAFEAPELAGPNFQLAWGARPVGELFDLINASMPPGQGGRWTTRPTPALSPTSCRPTGCRRAPRHLPSRGGDPHRRRRPAWASRVAAAAGGGPSGRRTGNRHPHLRLNRRLRAGDRRNAPRPGPGRLVDVSADL